LASAAEKNLAIEKINNALEKNLVAETAADKILTAAAN
jgi:hypothetical protein